MKYCIFHGWSKWSDPFNVANSYKIMQSRYCTICGKVEVRQIKQPFNEWFSSSVLKIKE